MFYLLSSSEEGYRVVDFALSNASLIEIASKFEREKASDTLVIVSDKVLSEAFLMESLGFGICLNEGGYLTERVDL